MKRDLHTEWHGMYQCCGCGRLFATQNAVKIHINLTIKLELRVRGNLPPAPVTVTGAGGGPAPGPGLNMQYFHKGLHGLKGPGPGYSIVVLSNLVDSPAELAAPAAGPDRPRAGPRPGASGGLAGGTARLLILPGPSSAEEPQNEDPAQSLSPCGSPGPPVLDEPDSDPEPGAN